MLASLVIPTVERSHEEFVPAFIDIESIEMGAPAPLSFERSLASSRFAAGHSATDVLAALPLSLRDSEWGSRMRAETPLAPAC